MANELRVDLDHLIGRESFRFVQPMEQTGDPQQQQSPKLRLDDLQDPYRTQMYRKPDFQRATAAWGPEQCLSLLESIVDNQVVPSIIMWASPHNTLRYILDGAHRISVVMAWMRDDWGDKRQSEDYGGPEEEDRIKRAAREVRALVNNRIGTIQEYKEAGEEILRLINEGQAPRQVMPEKRFRQGSFYNRLRSGDIAFDVLWVTGDYDRAERSFASINQSGTKLSEWELKLIENRNSSFIRSVMALANNASAEHYWLSDIPDSAEKPQLQQQAQQIVTRIHALHGVLFTPPFRRPARELRQPLFVIPRQELRPPYLAEFFAVIDGGRGRDGEIEAAIEKDKAAAPAEIIGNGARLLEKAIDTIEHVRGRSPRSMELVAPLYFYSDTGVYVRSLFYGFLHWLMSGPEEQVLRRKQLFSAYRGSFEQVLMASKADFISIVSRGTGSGPEVTIPTARYFQGLLRILIEHQGDIQTPDFAGAYETVLQSGGGGNRPRQAPTQGGRSRTFSPSMKSRAVLTEVMRSAPRCGICGGILDPQADLQHDHIQEFAKGGPTLPGNQRLTHPFCNNNRPAIETIRAGQAAFALPPLVEAEIDVGGFRQLRMFEDFFSQ